MKSSMIIHPDELSRTWIDRLADAGIDKVGIHSYGGKRAADFLKDMTALLGTREYRDLVDYAHVRGLEVEYELHTAGYLLPRDLFEAHPEYFRMNEHGIRTNDYNFCVSNSEAMDYFAKRSVELALSLYGSNRNFYFWLDDGGHGLFCHCERCKHLSASDQQLLVVNRMAKEIRKVIPDARVAYLAYKDTVALPSLSAEEGVFLEYAPFEKYTATGDNAPALIAREREMIDALMRVFSKEPAKVLEYWYDNSLYSRWKKPPARFILDEGAMISDIAEYRQKGFGEIATFACFLGDDYEALYGGVDISLFAKSVH
mgnify:CR=1 FL=1